MAFKAGFKVPFWSQALPRHMTCCLPDEELLLGHLDVLVSFTSVDCFSSGVTEPCCHGRGTQAAIPGQQGGDLCSKAVIFLSVTLFQECKAAFCWCPGISKRWGL